jgi:hypothetical protein
MSDGGFGVELDRMGRCARLAWTHAVDRYQAAPGTRSGVTTGHILLGVLKEESCAGGLILHAMGLDVRHAYGIVDFLLLHSRRQNSEPDVPSSWGGIAHTASAKHAMDLSLEEANLFTPTYPIGTEHLLLAVLRIPDSIACGAMRFLGIDEAATRAKRDELWTLLRTME